MACYIVSVGGILMILPINTETLQCLPRKQWRIEGGQRDNVENGSRRRCQRVLVSRSFKTNLTLGNFPIPFHNAYTYEICRAQLMPLHTTRPLQQRLYVTDHSATGKWCTNR